MSIRTYAVLLLASLLPVLAFGQAADVYNPAEAPSTTLHGAVPIQPNPERIAATLLDTRSNIITGIGTGPAGADRSTLQTTSFGMTTIGFGHQVSSGNRVADNFTVPAGGWVIDKITTYAYQTGSTTTSTMTDLRFQIWNGPPNVVGSTVVFGDITTNRMTATLFTGIYRDTETTSGNTTRPIMAVEAGGLSIFLPAGTYWLDWFVGGSLASGPWAVPLSILGQPITGDGLQFIADLMNPPGTWNNAVDGGTNTPAQGFPMTISGAVPGITVTQSGGTTDVTEGGATDSFTVVLASAPSSDVTITLTPDSQVSVSPTPLIFTSANWNVAQNVTVTAVNDAVVEGAHVGTISFAVTSADAAYNAFPVASVTANITDNDSAGITVVQSGGTTQVSESGLADTISVVLNSQPTANVTVTLSGGSQLNVSPTAFVFTPMNWNVPQFSTVSAINDLIIEGPHFGTISFAVTSSDANFNGLPVASITASIADNDAVPVAVPVFGPFALFALLLLTFGAAGCGLRRESARR